MKWFGAILMVCICIIANAHTISETTTSSLNDPALAVTDAPQVVAVDETVTEKAESEEAPVVEQSPQEEAKEEEDEEIKDITKLQDNKEVTEVKLLPLEDIKTNAEVENPAESHGVDELEEPVSKTTISLRDSGSQDELHLETELRRLNLDNEDDMLSSISEQQEQSPAPEEMIIDEVVVLQSPELDASDSFDESQQEVTFEDAGEISPTKVTTISEDTQIRPAIEAENQMTPVPEIWIVPKRAYTVATEVQSPRRFLEPQIMVGTPDSGVYYTQQWQQQQQQRPSSEVYREQSTDGRTSDGRQSTSTYDRRASQVGEYWREEERQKQMYDSQNTYRQGVLNRRYENERPPNLEDHNSPWRRQDPSLPLPQYASRGGDVLGVQEEDLDKEPANSVRLSDPRWPRRNMDHMGSYPRHPACRLPPKWGVGPEELSAWFYSQPEGKCLWFAYAGHGGNANRFYTRTNCESMCIFDQDDLCQNVRCINSGGSHCILRGDDRCKALAKRRGKAEDVECPPDQPVCRARRALIAPEQDSARIPRECFEEADHGSCLVKSPKIRYRYDPRSNTCRSFYFHDCGGNNNRFESMQECMNHCAL